MSDRSRSRSRDRSRSASPRRSSKHSSHRSEEKNNLPAGVEAISSDDYFLKSTEFRLWLKEEKNKYLDQLSGEDSRHYFKKFVKAWNRGKLSRSHYNPVSNTSLSASSQTSYKWKFASSLDSRQIEHARKTVDAETNLDRNAGPSAPPPPPSRVFGGRVVGPSAPPPSAGGFSESDRVMDREERKERERKERKAERKKGEKEEKEERSGGREGRIEKRRDTNASNREMRNKSPGGLEIDDATLMGTGGAGDDFAARIAARDRGAAQQQDRRAQQADARRSAVGTSSSALAERNKATMDMFKNLAAAKFGGGGGA